ncbi:MAG: hypothetical protein P4L50_19130 [Anaerolineaceae bacterium]|nr:hypothetical protein [Anaerolineaceae bacterium]
MPLIPPPVTEEELRQTALQKSERAGRLLQWRFKPRLEALMKFGGDAELKRLAMQWELNGADEDVLKVFNTAEGILEYAQSNRTDANKSVISAVVAEIHNALWLAENTS